ncbi:acyltransferase family protein [Parvularcula sp. ZS-1/3]|uniref:Acyltransferase family protein n=1 Tax=Parvularcula mediterranea TaxID=2732508 RepID=A0A7Y3W493_9PROT|nr:acyltransferase family protein [Parvularcula mediterranea]NNU15022.1 acyltransferase family protein [Parvularcula mediterranea]
MTTEFEGRIHALDSVRAGALLLGLAFHAGLSFYPGEQVWIVMDDARSAEIMWGGFTMHIFRMATFFIMAGYFGRMAFHRKGAGTFIASRAKRIGLPLVIFWPVMMVLFTVVMVWGLTKQWNITPEQLPEPPPMTLETFPLTHLWFLYVLLGFYAVMLVSRLPVALIDRSGGIRGAVDGALRFGLSSQILPILMAFAVAGSLLSHGGWTEWSGVPTPDTGVVPNRAALVTYGMAFTLGWLLQRQGEVLGIMRRLWPLSLVSAIGATAICLYLLGFESGTAPALEGRMRMIFAASYGLALWYWSFGLIGMALSLFNGESRVMRYLADASYWLYIMHLPLVMALQVWVMRWDWPALAKYGFILAVTLAVLLASYQLLVRHSFIGNLLNGPRRARS